MKFLLSAILLLSVTSHAQLTPQHYIDRHPQGVGIAPYANPGFGGIIDSQVNQCLLILDSFTTGKPPHGRIKNIYLRTGKISSTWWKGCKSTNVKLSLGYTNLLNFDTLVQLISNLTLVAYVDTLISDTIHGGWIRIPIKPEIQFYIDTGKNLVLEHALDTNGSRNLAGSNVIGCPYYGSWYKYLNDNKRYILFGTKSKATNVNTDRYFYDFGFDLYPTGIEAISNIEDVRIYPNPAREKCVVSFAVKKQVSSYSLSLKDVTGKELITAQYNHSTGNRFSKEIDVGQLPRGLYFVELKAGGEKIIRKVVLQ